MIYTMKKVCLDVPASTRRGIIPAATYSIYLDKDVELAEGMGNASSQAFIHISRSEAVSPPAFTAPETVLIFGQVTMGIFTKIKRMISAGQCCFQVTQQGVYPNKARHAGATPARSDHFRKMNRSSLFNGWKTVQSITDHKTGCT